MNQTQIKVFRRILDAKVEMLIKRHAPPSYYLPSTPEEKELEEQIKQLQRQLGDMSDERRKRADRVRTQIRARADELELEFLTNQLSTDTSEAIKEFAAWTPDDDA